MTGIGGAIGLAGAVLLIAHGRVAGISGIAGGLLSLSTRDRDWRYAFLGGLAVSGVALEVNGALDRLDASAETIRRAVAAGVKLVISTDSHHTSDLRRMEFGVANAQRGWAASGDVLNTLDSPAFLDFARSRR